MRAVAVAKVGDFAPVQLVAVPVLDPMLRRIRRSIAESEIVISIHALEELDSDGFTGVDVECCVLTGAIVERQRDLGTAEWKYVIQGRSTSGEECVVVVKWTPTGRVRVLTAFSLDR